MLRVLLLILLTLAALPASATYTKIANNGTDISSYYGSLGSNPGDWACTRDNVTGLIWEVKTTSGLRSQDNTYTNYDSSSGTALQIADATNSLGFVAAVNASSLCGYGEWRMPSKDELLSLVNTTETPITINTTYFPNTLGAVFWTGTPLAANTANALDIDFSTGASYDDGRDLQNRVRLVRSVPVPSSAFALTVSLSGLGSGSVNSGGIACTNSAGRTSGTCTGPRGSGSSVTLTATPATGILFGGWGGACSGTTPTCTLSMDAAKTVSARFINAFSKIANNGAELPDSALLGSAVNDWACTRDNTTGLIWEVKTTNGLRNQSNTYTNYDDTTQAQKPNGDIYVNPLQDEIDAASNSRGLVKTVNSSSLCGYSDWYLPNKDELNIVSTSSNSRPLNQTFFPNTPNAYFWSSSPYPYYNYHYFATRVYYLGGTYNEYRSTVSPVRLVRGGSSFATVALSVSTSGAGSGSINTGGINCQRAAGATSGACSANYGSASSVTLTATPAPGSLFATWGGACSGTAPTCTLSMDAAKSVSAQFNAGPLANGACGSSSGQTLSSAPSSRLCTVGTPSSVTGSWPRIYSWSCSGYNSGAPIACSATSSVDLFTLTVKKSGNGSVSSDLAGIDCGSDCSNSYPTGSAVTLTATPAAGSSFVGWGGACIGTVDLTCTLTLNASMSVTVNTETFTTYSKIANNGAVLADSAQLGSTATDWACTRANNSGTTWEVKTTDGGLRDQNKKYTNYDVNYDPNGQIDAASNSFGFATAVNGSALCGFNDWRIPVVDELLGLVDTSMTPAISPTYFPNTLVDLFWSMSNHQSSSGYAWLVDFRNDYYYGSITHSGQGISHSVRLMRSAQSVGTFMLRLSTTGTGSGTLTASDGSLHCAHPAVSSTDVCQTSLFNGATVTLTATPASGSGFSGWSGACSASSGLTCTVTMDAAKSVSANFAIPYVLTTSVSPPASGTASCTPNPVGQGGNSTCTATANLGYTFTRWSGDCTGATCVLSNITSTKTVTAIFTINTYTVAATVSPANSGTVSCSANPVNYNGSSTCTATPATGYTFSTWSGDCTGATCVLSNVISTKAVTATFTANTYAVTATASPTAGGSAVCTPNPVNHGSSSSCVVTPAAGYAFTGWSGDCTGTSCSLSNVTSAKRVVAAFMANSSTRLTASPVSPALPGQTTTLSVQVSGGVGMPTGNVVFKNASTELGTVPLNSSGGATYSGNFVSGTHSLSASYAGNTTYQSSVGSLSYQVSRTIDTTISVKTTPNLSQPGESVPISVTVTPLSNTGTLSGTVDVSSDGQNCRITLPAVSCSLVFASKGAKRLTATYSGNTLYNASTGLGTHFVGKKNSLTPILMLLLD